VIDGTHESEVSFLNQIRPCNPHALELPGHGDNKVKVVFDQTVLEANGFTATTADPLQKGLQIGCAEADFEFEISHAQAGGTTNLDLFEPALELQAGAVQELPRQVHRSQNLAHSPVESYPLSSSVSIDSAHGSTSKLQKRCKAAPFRFHAVRCGSEVAQGRDRSTSPAEALPMTHKELSHERNGVKSFRMRTLLALDRAGELELTGTREGLECADRP
jgi:hypothetical protein